MTPCKLVDFFFPENSEENSGSNFKTVRGRSVTVHVSEFIPYYTASHPRKKPIISPVSCVLLLKLHHFCPFTLLSFFPSTFLCLVAFLVSSCPSYQFIFPVYGPSSLLLTDISFSLPLPPHPTIFMSLFLTSIQCVTQHDLSRLSPAFQIRPAHPGNR